MHKIIRELMIKTKLDQDVFTFDTMFSGHRRCHHCAMKPCPGGGWTSAWQLAHVTCSLYASQTFLLALAYSEFSSSDCVQAAVPLLCATPLWRPLQETKGTGTNEREGRKRVKFKKNPNKKIPKKKNSIISHLNSGSRSFVSALSIFLMSSVKWCTYHMTTSWQCPSRCTVASSFRWSTSLCPSINNFKSCQSSTVKN